MCKDCVKESGPDRGNTCHEGGIYFMNYKGCSECGERMNIKNINKEREEDEETGEETITLTRMFPRGCDE